MTPSNGEDETGALALRVIALEAELENLQTESASDEPTVIPESVPSGSPDARVKPGPWIVVSAGRDTKVKVSSDDTRAAGLRQTDAELTAGKTHKIIGDDEEQIDETPADSGWIKCEVLGAAEANQQLVIQHKHTGETVDTTAYGDPCGVTNLRFDAGHAVAFQKGFHNLGTPWWFDAFTGEELS